MELAPGVFALPGRLLWLEGSRALVAADAHLGYEDVIGGALPLWSTSEIAATLCRTAAELGALEIVLLGDALHGARMNEGAASTVRAALDSMRSVCTVTAIAGNHEGPSRGVAILGEVEDAVERDGWLLLHGDRPGAGAFAPRIVGHLHPCIALGSDRSMPAFVSSSRLVVVPALTPYSHGLSVLSEDMAAALEAFGTRTRDAHVVASGDDRVFPFGTLSRLRAALRTPRGAHRRRRTYLLPDR